MGFSCSLVDQAVYSRRREDDHVVVGLHVDDGMEGGNSDKALDNFEQEFVKHFETKFQGS